MIDHNDIDRLINKMCTHLYYPLIMYIIILSLFIKEIYNSVKLNIWNIYTLATQAMTDTYTNMYSNVECKM